MCAKEFETKEKKRKFTLRIKMSDNIDIEALSIQQC